MLKRFMLASVFALATVGAASAQEVCQSLADAANDFDKVGVTHEMVASIADAELASIYLSASGLGVKEGSHPIGVVTITGPKGVVVGVVERELCIRHFAVVPVEKHAAAMDALAKQLGQRPA